MIQEIRLCWPNPDWCCLQGGCGYCSRGLEKDHMWKTPEQWHKYAIKTDLEKDWQYGYEFGWINCEHRLAKAS